MRKSIIFAGICIVLLVASAAFAEGQPSSKATAAVNTLVKCDMTTAQNNDSLDGIDDIGMLPADCTDLFTGATVDTVGGWIPIMDSKVKLSNSQSLFVSPSLVTGLYTRTRTKVNPKDADDPSVVYYSEAEAMGKVYLRAELIPDDGGDPILAAPLDLCTASIFGCGEVGGEWGVVLDSRIQTMSQELSECTVTVDAGDLGLLTGTCDFTSTIDFVLNTASAHTFNFIFPEVGQGTYKLQIYAAVGSDASIIGDGTAVGASAFGLGSVQIESVRFVHDFEF